MITFEEYNLLEAYISSDNFKILLEKNLGPNIDNDIKFGIVMATHDMNAGRANKARAKHMNTPDVLREALSSIKNQKYKNWKIYDSASAKPRSAAMMVEEDETLIAGYANAPAFARSNISA